MAEQDRNVIVEKMSIAVEGRDDKTLDLTGDLSKLKEQPFTLKEGVNYRIKIDFKVQHKIVSGLKYHHTVFRKGIRVDKKSYMVGSYGPKDVLQTFEAPAVMAPKGMLARGSYIRKSQFLDDDKNIYLQWEWRMDIKRDWD